jgi:hypothetical protein
MIRVSGEDARKVVVKLIERDRPVIVRTRWPKEREIRQLIHIAASDLGWRVSIKRVRKGDLYVYLRVEKQRLLDCDMEYVA